MYVRFVHPQPQPGQAEEYARRWETILAPRARAIPGFRAAYFVGDGTAETVHAIFIWDDQPGQALDQAMDDFRHQCRDITTGPALREDLVVLAEA
jgi:heme-degrading monooxygenase HmoA